MKEEFKLFVGAHPELIKYVNNNEMTWQKFYDMYLLYGDKSEAWNDYFKKNEIKEDNTKVISDIVNAIKKVDIDSVQKNISTINKALTLISSLLIKDDNKEVHYNVINNTIKSFNEIGFNIQKLTYSPIKGGSGNIEYLGYFIKDKSNNIDINNVIDEAFNTLK